MVDYIDMCNSIHKEFNYDYSKTKFTNLKDRITVICPIHGEFSIIARHHKNGSRCRKCNLTRPENKNRANARFIKRAAHRHNYFYDYTKINCIIENKYILIICPIHGEFKQTPHAHLSGQGCMQCGVKRRGILKSLTQEQFISISKSTQGELYDYSKAIYKGANKKVHIICPKHGDFFPQAKNHMMGHKCRKCSADNLRQKYHRVPLRKKIRISNHYKRWRFAVFSRDNFSCVFCSKSQRIQADHIKPFSIIMTEFEITTLDEALNCAEMWDINNGRTLCEECHKQTPTYGAKAKSFK